MTYCEKCLYLELLPVPRSKFVDTDHGTKSRRVILCHTNMKFSNNLDWSYHHETHFGSTLTCSLDHRPFQNKNEVFPE